MPAHIIYMHTYTCCSYTIVEDMSTGNDQVSDNTENWNSMLINRPAVGL